MKGVPVRSPAELNDSAKEGQAKLGDAMRSAKGQYLVEVLGRSITVLPRVFPPKTDTILLIKSAKINENETVLEPFAGTGAISVFLAENASRIVATDINPDAVKNINRNLEKFGLSKKARAEVADIFPDTNSVFDVIVANPPYTDNAAGDIIERAFWDKDHETAKRFFDNAKKHLKRGGRIYCSWSNFAGFELFEDMVASRGYKSTLMSEESKDWKTYRVYEIVPT